MVSAMKKEKCDICGTHFDRLSPRLRTWREWKWTRPDGLWNTDLVFYSIMFLHCVMFLIDLKRIDRHCEAVRTIYGPNSWLYFLVGWLRSGPHIWGIYVVLAFSLLYGVKLIYIAAKHWIAENTVYEWREGGVLRRAA
ncbi:hypothetical protein AAVH_16483 [Aphelenchoides avenae]|nr:hypothetical protein AAVH_16483 [Aphelenchus avenae]